MAVTTPSKWMIFIVNIDNNHVCPWLQHSAVKIPCNYIGHYNIHKLLFMCRPMSNFEDLPLANHAHFLFLGTASLLCGCMCMCVWPRWADRAWALTLLLLLFLVLHHLIEPLCHRAGGTLKHRGSWETESRVRVKDYSNFLSEMLGLSMWVRPMRSCETLSPNTTFRGEEEKLQEK